MFRLLLFALLFIIVFPMMGQKQLYKKKKTFESENFVFNPDSSRLIEEAFYDLTGKVTKEIHYYSFPEVWNEPSYLGKVYYEITYRYDVKGNLWGSERIMSGKHHHEYKVNDDLVDSWEEFIRDYRRDVENYYWNTKGKVDSIYTIHYESSMTKNKNWQQGSQLLKYERLWKVDTSSHIYRYDEQNLLVSEEFHSGEGGTISLNIKHDTIRYSYDSIGRKTEETYLNGSKLNYFYDKRNRLAREEEYRQGAMEPAFPMLSEYSEEERKKILEERGITEEEANGLAYRLELVRTREYQYDSKNRLVKKLSNDETLGNLGDPDTEEFWYDKNGLLIRKTTITSGPKYYHYIYE